MEVMATKPPDWPIFETEMLQQYSVAIEKRRKSLRYRAGLSCEREVTMCPQGNFERLNLALPGCGLRLSAWEDGIIWVSVSVAAPGRNAGWAFEDAFHGRLDDISPLALLNMIEATLEIPFGSDPVAERPKLRLIWQRILRS
ncbi:MAG: hypothetical protein ACRC8S_13830 [Fimbriiglobus sp.]